MVPADDGKVVADSPDPSGSAEASAQAALGQLYRDLEKEVARVQPRCELSGRCCDFKTSNLTLFATDLEIRWLEARTAAGEQPDPELCPHYVNKLCEARDGRPLGCRVYFCDTSTQVEMEQLSERFHQRLKQIHDECEVDYSYQPFVRRLRDRS